MRWRELRPCVLGCGCSPEHRLLHQGVTWSGGAQPLQSLQSLHACMQTLFPTLHQQVAWVPTLDNHSVRMMRCESFNHVTVLSDGHLFFSPWLFLLSAWSLSSVVCAPALFGPTFYFWSCVCVCVHARVCEYLPCSWFCFWFSLDSAFLSSVSVSLTCYVEPPPPTPPSLHGVFQFCAVKKIPPVLPFHSSSVPHRPPPCGTLLLLI